MVEIDTKTAVQIAIDALVGIDHISRKQLAAKLDMSPSDLSKAPSSVVTKLEQHYGFAPGQLEEFGQGIRSLRSIVISGPRPEVTPSSEHRSWRLNTVRGLYQVFRPHTDSQRSFMAEPMQLTLTNDGLSADLFMYSRKKLTRDRLYSGPVQVHPRYIVFGLLRRPRDTVTGGLAFRAIGLRVDLDSSQDAYCGLMMRGSATEAVVAHHFVAIRCVSEDSHRDGIEQLDLRDAAFPRPSLVRQGEGLYRIFPSESLLIGEITKVEMPRTFGFCSAVFANLAMQSEARLKGVLYTIRPSDLVSCLQEAGMPTGVYYAGWRAMVDEDLGAIRSGD